ncbi:MAG: DUF4238 domain-containing protein [Planctomycetota bacterium]
MGYHYVPQRYLKNFSTPNQPELIWLHDKKGGAPKLVPIEVVAQAKGYYSEQTEGLLAREVEGPANIVIQKLMENKSLDRAERFRLTYYLGTMLKRVPYRRRKAMEMYPSVLDDTIARVREQIKDLAHSLSGADSAIVDRRLAEVDAAHRKLATKPPPEIVTQVREPWPSERMLDAIYRMTWHVLVSDGPQYFITSDNPAFFFGSYGLGTPKAELTFPLSTTHCLHGCWQGVEQTLLFMGARQAFIKEANRRLASATERLAFYHEPAPWLERILRKKDPYLSAIRW